ncbi:MAG: hypothetical protein H0X34_01840 [Chthoniobacterales bacterium]|nr:hypothetical protein [Chthoniobacterales bacterium]
MTAEPIKYNSLLLSRLVTFACTASLASGLFLIPWIQSTEASSATWNLNPITSDWSTAANWTPATIPNGPADSATFDLSSTRDISISSGIQVASIAFNAGASAFTISIGASSGLIISGAGITNNSGVAQNFVHTQVGTGLIQFLQNATAGSEIVFTNGGGGVMDFFDRSSAGNATVINNGTAPGISGGATSFFDDSTAANGTLINEKPTGGSTFGGLTGFHNRSTAGASSVISYAGATTEFLDAATAGNSSLIANGGSIEFSNKSMGETSRVEIFGFGQIDISPHDAPGLTIGSLEGDSYVFLGKNNLTVGTNSLSTVFSGLIQDGGLQGGTGGSLTKVGTGTLTLGGANLYTGGTVLSNGELTINNTAGSGTGSGAVLINGGTLRGRGVIAGAVTVGTGAFLAPGNKGRRPGTLTIQSTLTFKTDATYTYRLSFKRAEAAKVVADGVSVESSALFSSVGVGAGKLSAGTVFTAISNTAATPIAGTFANLPDHSSFSAGNNTFEVTYEGGDGNDLTLTVVP